MSTHLRLALAFGILSSIPLPARADVIIFSNLIGPCCGGYGLFGSDFLGSNSMAEAFTPEVTIPLSAAQVVVFSDAPSDRHFNISLFSDISGLPGTLIEQIGSELLAPPGIGGIVSASSHLMPTLKSGTQYWLVLTPFSTSTTIAWEQGPARLFHLRVRVRLLEKGAGAAR